MQQTKLTMAIVAALYTIRHNGIDYEAGDLFEVPKTQAVFLRMAKCVREPTASEIEDWQAQKQAEQQAATLYINEEELPTPQHAVATDSTETADAVTDDNQTATDMAADVVVDDAYADTDHADVVIGEAVSLPESDVAEEEISKSTNPYDGWLKKDLNAELDKRGIDHDDKARNDELEQLLIDDDAKQA
ncbi:hypothetical protein [Psychrobacter lutiphocae]|uniref:hypothetical protein n=1 Tax=Psychrobacter lutiphocae TaxID=540500 RepID=UPI00037CDC31|nr:hypothetical protein [Psychrobacter lutiphocae]